MRPLLMLVCCAMPLVGQQVHFTAHPQETLQTNIGNFSPFGCFNSGSGAEARSQILLRAFELPGPGAVLTGIEVRSWQTQGLVYSSLQIDVQPTTATALVSAYAANVTAPQTVLQATALTVAYTAGAWTPILFTTPYVHDGVSSLVIDTRKVVDPTSIVFVTMDNGQSPPRIDRPQMVYGFGGPGSGAVNSPSAFASTEPIAVRLRWSGAPVMRHSADRAASGQQYGLGGSVSHTIQGAAGAVFLSVIADNVLPAPVPVPPVVGGAWVVGGVVWGFGVLDAAGMAQLVVTIPGRPGLVGMYLGYQSGTLDAVSGVAQFTNGTDHFVNP